MNRLKEIDQELDEIQHCRIALWELEQRLCDERLELKKQRSHLKVVKMVTSGDIDL